MSRVIIGILFTVCLSLTGCRLSANFHVLDPENKVFRSAQLTASELNELVKHTGLKTIINLRGESDSKWFHKEAEIARKHGIQLVNIKMSAGRLPHRADLIKLLDAFRDSPRPMLIHCAAGVDRTGEASAIYKLEYMGKTRKQALRQLTPYYLHFEKKFPAKRYFIGQIYQGERWARETYDPCVQKYEHYDQASLCADNSERKDIEELDTAEALEPVEHEPL